MTIKVFKLFGAKDMLFTNKKEKHMMQLLESLDKMIEGDFTSEMNIAEEGTMALLMHKTETLRQELLKKQEKSSQLQVAQNSLVTSISHDLRTPLTSLIGYLEILIDENQDNDALNGYYLSACLARSNQLKDLVDTAFEHFFLNSDASELTTLMRCNSTVTLINLLRIRIDLLTYNRFEVQARLPEFKYALVYDCRLVERLLDNITTNILRHGNPNAPVTIELEIKNAFLEVRFVNGLHKNSPLYIGNSTGIGLMNCQKIMALHRGNLETFSDHHQYYTIATFPIDNKGTY